MAKGAKAKGKKVRVVGSKRDLEHLLHMHGHREEFVVRLRTLHGLQSARVMQRALRRQIREKSWIVEGMDHLDALVDLHYMIADSASLLDEVIWRMNDAQYLGDHTSAAAYEHPGAIILDDPSTSTGQGSAHLILGDNSASGYQGSAERNPAVLPDDGESTSTRHDSAEQKCLILGENLDSGNQDSGERQDLLVLGDHSASGSQDSIKPAIFPDGESTSRHQAYAERERTGISFFVGGATHHPTTPRRDRSSSDVLVLGGATHHPATPRPDRSSSDVLVLGGATHRPATPRPDRSSSDVLGGATRHPATPRSDRSSSDVLGGATRHPATPRSDPSSSHVLGTTNRERTALLFDRNSSVVVGAANDRERVTLPFDSYPSLGRRAADHERARINIEPPSSALLGASDRLPANRATCGVQGGARGERPDHDNDNVPGDCPASYSRTLSPAAPAPSQGVRSGPPSSRPSSSRPSAAIEPDGCYNLDLATHRLFVSGTNLRHHQMGSPAIQLIVQVLGRQIEEVAHALQDARLPPEVLQEELKRVKLLLHEVWSLRIPNSDFKLM